jgi:hypothetical protein
MKIRLKKKKKTMRRCVHSSWHSPILTEVEAKTLQHVNEITNGKNEPSAKSAHR